jgi:predicted lipid-binding transport protein (Tim44 family)
LSPGAPPGIVPYVLRLSAACFSLLTALVLAPAAFGAAGGGSSGFGGGGGGGGGGGFSGGGGTGAGGGGVSFVVVLLIVIVVLVVVVAGAVAERRRRRRRDARAAQVRLAAAEAAEDDAAFDAQTVEREARELFVAVQAAWTARDREALKRMVSPSLMLEWGLRLDDFDRKGWHNQVTVSGEPGIYYVGLVNRESDAEDRAVVLIEATLNDCVVDRHGNRIKRKESSSETTKLREYWTLGKRDGRWALLSIEQLAEGEHNLSSDLVASPSGDARLRDESVMELASADAAPEGTDIAALVGLDYAGDGRKAALDLSLVDGRFAPEVLETSARRAIAAWAEAVDGTDDALLAVATPAATTELLYPRGGHTARLVVRGPQLERMTLVALEGESDPPRMVVEVALSGRRYVEDRNTVAVLEGSRDAMARWTERWTFALDGADTTPWRMVGATQSTTSGAV